MNQEKMSMTEMEEQIIAHENRPRGVASILSGILPIAMMYKKLGLGQSFSGKTERGKTIHSGKTQYKHEKIGRNQPCTCGSGKKFKHCCLKK